MSTSSQKLLPKICHQTLEGSFSAVSKLSFIVNVPFGALLFALPAFAIILLSRDFLVVCTVIFVGRDYLVSLLSQY